MKPKEGVPFLDLVKPHQELKEEFCDVFRRALDRAAFIGGEMVEQLEHEFALFSGTQYCVGTGSGTDALRFVLLAERIQKDSLVITVPNTFIATTEAISQAGATPVFVDVDEQTLNMDPLKLRAYLERQCYVDAESGEVIDRYRLKPVRAVIPVHMYGRMADMDPILDIAEEYRLTVIEDACQAHGAEHFSRSQQRWMKAGSVGTAAAFSFYPGKNLGACGEAGAVTTNNGDLAWKVRILRDHGQAKKYYHDMEGYNGRLDAIQAGILQVKLKHLAHWNEQRRAAAERYRELLGKADLEWLAATEPAGSRSVYHLFVVRTPERERLRKHLAENGIETGVHYPIPLHLQEAYRGLGYRSGDFPVAEAASREILSLPMFPQLTRAQQERVVKAVREFVLRPQMLMSAV